MVDSSDKIDTSQLQNTSKVLANSIKYIIDNLTDLGKALNHLAETSSQIQSIAEHFRSIKETNKTIADLKDFITKNQELIKQYKQVFSEFPADIETFQTQIASKLEEAVKTLSDKNIIKVSSLQLQRLSEEIIKFKVDSIASVSELEEKYPRIVELFSKVSKTITQLPEKISPALEKIEKVRSVVDHLEEAQKSLDKLVSKTYIGKTVFKKAADDAIKFRQGFEQIKHPLAGFREIFNTISKTITPVGAVFLVIWKIIEAILSSSKIVSENVAKLGYVATAVKSPMDTVINLGRKFALQARFVGRDLGEMLEVTSKGFEIGLYSMKDLARGITDDFLFQVGIASNTIDRFAKQINVSFEEAASQLILLRNIVHTAVSGVGEEGANRMINYFNKVNQFLQSQFGTHFKEFTNILKNVFSNILFLGTSAGTNLLQTTIGFSSRLIEYVKAKLTDGFEFTKEHVTTILNEINNAVGRSSWELYYGVLATTGRLSGDLNETLKKAFSADPMQRFLNVSSYFYKLLGRELPDVFAGFIPGLEGLRNYPGLVEKLSGALRTLFDNIAAGKLDLSKVGNVEEFLKKAGMETNELVLLRESMENFGDPLKTLVNLVQKILNLLQMFVGRSVVSTYGRAVGGFVKK